MKKGLRSKGPAETQPDIHQQKQRKGRTPNMASPGQELNLGDLMEAIKAGTKVSNDIAKKVDKIQAAMTIMDNKLTSLTERVETMEQRISDGEDLTARQEGRLQTLEKEIATLQEKNLDFEQRSRRFNVKVQGLAEGRELPEPLTFFETFFQKLLDAQTTLPATIQLQVVHRTPSKHPPEGQPPAPRTIWVRFLRLQDKQKVLQLSREKGNLTFEGSTIKIFPDIPPTLLKRRKELFSEAKQILKDNGIEFGIFHPSTLTFDYEGRKKSFRSKEEIDTFLKDNGLTRKLI